MIALFLRSSTAPLWSLTKQRSIHAEELRRIYDATREACSRIPSAPRVDPRAVFANNELDLGLIDVTFTLLAIMVYGFDYDYTLAVYTRELNALIYKLALRRLISQFKYPSKILDIPYDSGFAIRGLHFDVQSSCLLKVDAFSQIQSGSVYRGRKKLSEKEVKKFFPRLCLPDMKGRQMPQLVDFYSLPWAGLLTTVVHYCDIHNIVFDPKCLFDDLEECVKQVHVSGEMYKEISDDLKNYVHPNEGLKEYLEVLHANGKELFVVTNSPFISLNSGMTYMLGADWRKYFKYIVVSAKKPTFFRGREPFRIYDPDLDMMRFEKVNRLEEGQIYSGGNIDDLSTRAGFKDKGVLYFGDHIYTDLAAPILGLGWRTAAVVPELAREIRIQNDHTYQSIIKWLAMLTTVIEVHRPTSLKNQESLKVIEEWITERSLLRDKLKALFNPQFGSIFRTYHNMTDFCRRLSRLSDVYTSRVPNMLKYDINHRFFPRRNALPHENLHSFPISPDSMFNIMKDIKQLERDIGCS